MAARKKFHKWTMDFTGHTHGKGSKGGAGPLALQGSTVSLKNPYGYSGPISKTDFKPPEPDDTLIVKKSWDIALGPLKQVPMNVFIMWMAGNTISIFPIMMVGMMFFRPIQALMTVQTTAFKMIEGDQAAVQKFVYLLGNFLCLGLAIYKCQGMGLLPTTTSDWLAFVEPQKRLEWSGGGAML